MIVKAKQTEKALGKLRQQFTKCVLSGCVHPSFGICIMPHPGKKCNNLLTFFQKIFPIFSNDT